MLKSDTLHYTERTDKDYRDYRSIEYKRNKKFYRISINGIHRTTRYQTECHRYGNPGFSIGFNRAYVNWVHFKRHCWHLSFNYKKRGITFSYGKAIV